METIGVTDKFVSNKDEDEMEKGQVRRRTNGEIKNDPESSPDQETNGKIAHEELEYSPSGWMEVTLSNWGGSTDKFLNTHGSNIRTFFIVLLNAVIVAFFFAALYYYLVHDTHHLQLCYGFGSLIALITIIYFFIIYFLVLKRFFGKWFYRVVWSKVEKGFGVMWRRRWFRWCLSLVISGGILIYLVLDTLDNPSRLISLSGLGTILLLGFLFSAHPGRVNWRTVSVGLLLQFVFGLLFIRWDAGRFALQCFSNKVATFLSYGVDGAGFVFGDMLVHQEQVFAFSTLPVIFFFSMLVEVLFFWGALQWFCMKLGHLLRAATNTTVCESVIAVGNTFLGMTESILLIKPYVEVLTASEIHVIMASGFATVSGTMLAAYLGFGAEAAHLVTASVMSAPAAICYAKLLLPETRKSLTAVDNIVPVESPDQSALSAATRGATNGIALILNIIANLIAFVAVIAFLNGVLGYLGGLLGFNGLNLEWIFGKVFIPFSFVMGVPWKECEQVGTLIGLKTVVNEFVAYQRMGEMKEMGLLSPRSEMIATYALCGFTNPASAAILIGSMASVAPNQREILSKTAVRAFFAGCGICFMNASLAGLLMPEGSFN